VLAKTMQAQVRAGGPPPAIPCDMRGGVISQIHVNGLGESNGPAGPDRVKANPTAASEH